MGYHDQILAVLLSVDMFDWKAIVHTCALFC